jgi:hypothetical protein
MVEQIVRREVVHTRQTFGEHWAVWLERRKPYLESGTWGAYERWRYDFRGARAAAPPVLRFLLQAHLALRFGARRGVTHAPL